MQCSCCKKILDKDKFSLKNEDKKIYYLHCNNCREKLKTSRPDKQKQEKQRYEKLKKDARIECNCGSVYVAFRDFHILRHLNTLKHKAYLSTKASS